jgi:hypothetical protein
MNGSSLRSPAVNASCRAVLAVPLAKRRLEHTGRAPLFERDRELREPRGGAPPCRPRQPAAARCVDWRAGRSSRRSRARAALLAPIGLRVDQAASAAPSAFGRPRPRRVRQSLHDLVGLG